MKEKIKRVVVLSSGIFLGLSLSMLVLMGPIPFLFHFYKDEPVAMVLGAVWVLSVLSITLGVVTVIDEIEIERKKKEEKNDE